MSKIMVLPGTFWQIPIMKKIKSLGHELYVVNPVINDDVYQLADHFWEEDIFNYSVIIPYCKNNGIDVVISEECDIATDAVAKINNAIGANCLTTDMAELFTNKFRMRQFCEEKGFGSIPYRLCQTKDEAHAFFSEYGPLIILKPLDSNASHGVFTITSHTDIDENFDKSLQFSRNEKKVLVEKYIEGTEFTVDGIMTANGHLTLAISEKDHYKHNKNIANSLYFTQHNSKFDYDELRETNNRLLNATGLPFGLTHVEYKFQDNKFYLIEMAARGGGNLISAIIAPFMSGIDSYDYLINCCLDRDYQKQLAFSYDNHRTSILKFLDLPCEGGYVKEILGEEYLRTDRRVKSFRLNFKVGDYIHQPESDSVRIGYYIICADSLEEFEEVIHNIEKKFRIILR